MTIISTSLFFIRFFFSKKCGPPILTESLVLSDCLKFGGLIDAVFLAPRDKENILQTLGRVT